MGGRWVLVMLVYGILDGWIGGYNYSVLVSPYRVRVKNENGCQEVPLLQSLPFSFSFSRSY